MFNHKIIRHRLSRRENHPGIVRENQDLDARQKMDDDHSTKRTRCDEYERDETFPSVDVLLLVSTSLSEITETSPRRRHRQAERNEHQ